MARRPLLSIAVALLSSWGCQRPGPATPEVGTPTTPASSSGQSGSSGATVVRLPKSVPLPEIFLQGSNPNVVAPPAGGAMSRDEQELLRASNEARGRRKLALFRCNPALCEIARVHAGRMARQRQNAYELEGRSLPGDVEARFPDQSYAMTIGSASILDGGQIVDSWLKDPQIREQFLDAEYQETGIGIVRDGSTYYYVEIMQAPKK